MRRVSRRRGAVLALGLSLALHGIAVRWLLSRPTTRPSAPLFTPPAQPLDFEVALPPEAKVHEQAPPHEQKHHRAVAKASSKRSAAQHASTAQGAVAPLAAETPGAGEARRLELSADSLSPATGDVPHER